MLHGVALSGQKLARSYGDLSENSEYDDAKTVSAFYATGKDKMAYLLIYGEPVFLLLLLLILPEWMGIGGTWVSVPVSQILIMLASLFFLYHGKHPGGAGERFPIRKWKSRRSPDSGNNG